MTTDLSPTIYSRASTYAVVTLTVAITAVGGQINRYINPVWLQMDANSEFYPGGEVIGQILRAHGLQASYHDGFSRYARPVVVDRDGYRYSARPSRNRVAMASDAYDTADDSLSALEYLDRNYDYADGTIRGSGNRYRNGGAAIDVPSRRNRINAIPLPRTTGRYYPSDYGADRPADVPSLQPYSRSRWLQLRATSDVQDPSYQESGLRSRETARLVPRSTVAPNTGEKRTNV